MRTYPIGGPVPFAFELESAYIQPRAIAGILSHAPGVSDVVRRRLYSAPSDVHITFAFRDRPYMVWEPFGDNSRYWIGPDDDNDVEAQASRFDISPLERLFRWYQLPLLIRVLGDVILFRLPFLWPDGAPPR